MPGIRQDEVLQALEQSGGVVRRVGRTDPLAKLLKSMGRDTSNNHIPMMRNLIVGLVKAGKVVTEGPLTRLTLVATPEAFAREAATTKEADMVGRPGQRATTQARRGDGSKLPERLTDDLVGPVTVSYLSDEVREEIEVRVECVLGDLCTEVAAGTCSATMGRTAFRQKVVELLRKGGDDAAASIGLADQVVCALASHKQIRYTEKKGRQEATFTVVIEEPEAKPAPTKDEALKQLIGALTEAKARIATLEEALAKRPPAGIDPERVTMALDQLEAEKAALVSEKGALAREKADLERRLSEVTQAATTARQRADARATGQQRTISELEERVRELTATIAGLQSTLANAGHEKTALIRQRTELQAEVTALKKRQVETVDAELDARLRDLLGE